MSSFFKVWLNRLSGHTAGEAKREIHGGALMVTAARRTEGETSIRSDGLWVGGAQVLTVVVGVAMTVLAANLLTTEQFAAANWLLSWLLYTAAVARFGSLQASTMLVASEPSHARSISAKLLFGTLTFGLALSVVWLAFGRDLVASFVGTSAGYSAAFSVFPFWLPAAASVPLVGGLLRGLGNFRAAVVFGEYLRRGSIVLALLWFQFGSSPVSLTAILATAVMVEWIALVVGVWTLFRTTAGAFRPTNVDGDRAISIMKRTTDFYALSVVAVVVPQGAVWLLAFVSDDDAVSQLAVALRISLLFVVPFAVGSRVFAPRIARAAKAGSLAKLQPQLQLFSLLTFAVVAIGLGVTFLFGGQLIPWVFGAQFEDAWQGVLILAVGGAINTGTGLSMAVLSNSGQARIVSFGAVVTGVFFVALVLLLGGRYGTNGAALGATIALATQNLVMAAISTKRTGLWVGFSPSALRPERLRESIS